MKNWQALLLGSTMLKPLRGRYYEPVTVSGCALGMIDRGSGVLDARHRLPLDSTNAFYCSPLARMEYAQRYLPCGCDATRSIMWGGGILACIGRSLTIQYVIVHLFNQHVIDGSWSIERLAEWLRGIEDAEDAEFNPTSRFEKSAPKEEKVLDLVEV